MNTTKSKLIIFGSKSFVAKSIIGKLKENNTEILELSRDIVNFENELECEKLVSRINNGDKVLFIAGKVPVKNLEMLLENIKICKNICDILEKKEINHITYLSSDAVYKDTDAKIDENSICEPDSLHGLMHLTREKYLQSKFDNLCIVRPTLIYGIDDPHNGYGPNKFYKNATNNQNIELFGNGEEKRDHIFVEDVAEIIVRLIKISYVGKLNATTGKTSSFSDIAIKVKDIINPSIEIIKKKRYGPMPHNGYRPFNNNKIFEIFPDFKFNNIENWLKDIK